METLENIPISIREQHKLLNLLAQGYKSLSKALMEYIDNSFDSADDFYNANNLYSRLVSITLMIDRNQHKISIKDNCEGMNIDILKGLANSINDSEKRRRGQKRPWVNGQFGLGAHAFRFFAQKLIVITKQTGENQIALLIDRDNPNAQRIKLEDKNLGQSGTLVEILDVDKNELKNLNCEELKKEIEIYFEMLLRRNVEIKIVDSGIQSLCIPFDYDKIQGLSIKKEILSWRRGTATVSVPQGKGIDVNLKVCAYKIDRPPFFSRKGRRINYIARVDSFINKTLHRKKVWENYYLTGFIEIGDNLEPVITRDDFVGGKGYSLMRCGIYEEIVKLEDEIHNAIETINKDRSDENLKSLASMLTDFLSEIAKDEEIKLRYENMSSKGVKGEWTKVVPDNKSIDMYEVGRRHNGHDHEGKKRIIPATPNSENDLFGRKIEGEKEGIRIEFSTLPVQASDRRAVYGDSVITIFTAHPDFIDRRGNNELEQTRITPRLANYLSAIISSEYKEVFYNLKKLEPDRKKVLDEQIEFIFRFEEKLKDLINLPLDTIGQVSHT